MIRFACVSLLEFRCLGDFVWISLLTLIYLHQLACVSLLVSVCLTFGVQTVDVWQGGVWIVDIWLRISCFFLRRSQLVIVICICVHNFHIELIFVLSLFFSLTFCLFCSVQTFFQPLWGGGVLPWGGGVLPWGGMMRRTTSNMSALVFLQRLSMCMLVFVSCEAQCSIVLCGHVTAHKL